jgi:hypothetical protein
MDVDPKVAHPLKDVDPKVAHPPKDVDPKVARPLKIVGLRGCKDRIQTGWSNARSRLIAMVTENLTAMN